MGLISSSYNFLGNFFRGGKDQFTQTRYVSHRNQILTKGEQWIDNSQGNLYELYRTTPQLKAVIDKKASMLSNGVWKHIKGEEVVENSPIVELFNNPNPLLNKQGFLKQYSIERSIYGNAIINCNKGLLSEVPQSMYVLPTCRMSVVTTGAIYKQVEIANIIDKYIFEDNEGKKEDFEAGEVIHFMDCDPNNPVMGMSKLVALTMPISNIRAAYGFKNRIITSNSALGILSNDSIDGNGVPLDKKEGERISKAFGSKYGMQDGKNDIVHTETRVKWNAMSYPTKDLMLSEEIEECYRAIIDGFNLNKNIFSAQTDSKFSNMNEGLKMAYQDCILPEAEEVSKAFTEYLGMDGQDEYIYLCYDHLEVLKDNEEVNAKTLKLKAESIAILNEQGRTEDAEGIVI